MLSRFDTLPERDRQTDRRILLYQYGASAQQKTSIFSVDIFFISRFRQRNSHCLLYAYLSAAKLMDKNVGGRDE